VTFVGNGVGESSSRCSRLSRLDDHKPECQVPAQLLRSIFKIPAVAVIAMAVFILSRGCLRLIRLGVSVN